jgi:hypothetical protein
MFQYPVLVKPIRIRLTYQLTRQEHLSGEVDDEPVGLIKNMCPLKKKISIETGSQIPRLC